MSLKIASLNSGSNGNCYYIGNNNEAVLIDAGLSCRETEKRMRQLGLSMNKVKGIFISHEHSDHIKALPVLAEKYNIPVHITENTLKKGGIKFKKQLINDFIAYEPVLVGGFSVTAFPKHHDAIDPHSFMISFSGINVGVFTDIGNSCANVINHFSQCHAAFLETNYDESLLENGRYPTHLKNRIRGGKGHLSNKQALEIFNKHRPVFMSHLVLSHLSEDNNRPELVKQLFDEHAIGVKIIVASRYEPTAIYSIQHPEISGPGNILPVLSISIKQLSLF
jgi:phosphoribosyl 1,2-cyclic phosphodiesterase